MEITAAYYIGFILIVVILVYVIVVFSKNPNKPTKASFTIPNGTLEEKKIVLDSNLVRTILLGNSDSTILVYVFLQPSDKTPRTDQMPNTLLQIPGVLQFNYGGVNSELVVNTINTANNQTVEERIEIPAIPMQKWIQLGILREGRRFDIMYNNKIIASKRLAYMPVYATASLEMGGSQVRGTFSEGRVYNYRLSLKDVQKELSSTSDTRHKPPTDTSFNIVNPFTMFSCPGGFFCGADARQPKNALQEWQTPYA